MQCPFFETHLKWYGSLLLPSVRISPVSFTTLSLSGSSSSCLPTFFSLWLHRLLSLHSTLLRQRRRLRTRFHQHSLSFSTSNVVGLLYHFFQLSGQFQPHLLLFSLSCISGCFWFAFSWELVSDVGCWTTFGFNFPVLMITKVYAVSFFTKFHVIQCTMLGL